MSLDQERELEKGAKIFADLYAPDNKLVHQHDAFVCHLRNLIHLTRAIGHVEGLASAQTKMEQAFTETAARGH